METSLKKQTQHERTNGGPDWSQYDTHELEAHIPALESELLLASKQHNEDVALINELETSLEQLDIQLQTATHEKDAMMQSADDLLAETLASVADRVAETERLRLENAKLERRNTDLEYELRRCLRRLDAMDLEIETDKVLLANETSKCNVLNVRRETLLEQNKALRQLLPKSLEEGEGGD